MAQDSQHVAGEFGKLVEEQHAAMGEVYSGGAADDAGIGNGVMRGEGSVLFDAGRRTYWIYR